MEERMKGSPTAAAPRFPVVLSIAASVATLALKTAAYLLTGSVGLLSDAAESLVNLVASTTALFCMWYAARPVDPSHTYGHEKIEYFSSGLEGMLILVAAGGIAWYAVRRLLFPEPLHELGLGTLVAFAASLINLAVAQVLLRVGRASESIVLEADGRHLMTDVWTSVVVLAGLGLVYLTGLEVLDPILALLVAANIVWTATGLVRRSFNGLMDHSLPEPEQAIVRAAIRGQLGPGMAFHALRTRQAGAHRFADCHLLLPGTYSLQQAHAVANQVEKAVEAALPGIEVTVHLEPIEERGSWEDSALLNFEKSGLSEPEV
jgi:cation diffusion facilitator family transporter